MVKSRKSNQAKAGHITINAVAHDNDDDDDLEAANTSETEGESSPDSAVNVTTPQSFQEDQHHHQHHLPSHPPPAENHHIDDNHHSDDKESGHEDDEEQALPDYYYNYDVGDEEANRNNQNNTSLVSRSTDDEHEEQEAGDVLGDSINLISPPNIMVGGGSGHNDRQRTRNNNNNRVSVQPLPQTPNTRNFFDLDGIITPTAFATSSDRSLTNRERRCQSDGDVLFGRSANERHSSYNSHGSNNSLAGSGHNNNNFPKNMSQYYWGSSGGSVGRGTDNNNNKFFSPQSRRGSMADNERGHYLRHLYLKRQVAERFDEMEQESIRDETTQTGGIAGDTTVSGRSIGDLSDLDEELSILSDQRSVEQTLHKEFSTHWNIRARIETEEEVHALVQEVKAEQQLRKRTNLSLKIEHIREMVRPYESEGQTQLEQWPLEVRLDNVTYEVETMDAKKSNKIQNVYNTSPVYHFWKWIRKAAQCQLLSPEHRKPDLPRQHILKNIHLAIQPGKQYLVLGPPASGKSTLLKTIAGLLPAEKQFSLSGSVTYNGKTMEDSDHDRNLHIENAFGYIDQLDKHAALLTVSETLNFAFHAKAGGKAARDRTDYSEDQIILADKADEDQLMLRVVLEMLGLSEVKNTFVGDTNVRGISGGQRRRVTVGEMIMDRVPVLCGDEISTGLDAASTFDMVELMLYFGRQHNFSRVFALLQPSPEVVALFDEVVVLAEGRIIYAGPIESVEDYFADRGFICPKFVDVADFLQMVSTEDREDLYIGAAADRDARAPTVDELADIFHHSEFGRRIQNLLEGSNQFPLNDKGDIERGAGDGVFELEAVKHKYANGFFRSLYLITKRFLLLWVRDRKVLAFSVVRNVVNGASVGGAFFNADDFLSIQGALFQTGIFVLLGSLQTSSGMVADRVLYHKHANANFYSAWPYTFGRAMSTIPQTFCLDTLVSGATLYYLIGLGGRESFTNFITYASILFCFAMVMNQQMAVFASFASESQLQVFSACILFFAILFSGYILPLSTIPPYYEWIFWWNPFAWAYNAMVMNEVYCGRWENPEAILKANGFVYSNGQVFTPEWIGWAIGYMVIYFFLCCILTALGLAYGGSSSSGHRRPAKKPIDDDESDDEESDEEEAMSNRIHIPFTPMTLSFQNLCYEVKASTSKEKLMLLKNVNGIFRPGRMCALMGSSGAGKTTLMDVIALRKQSGTITGDVYLNGYPQDPISFRRSSGYVEQFDVQSPELTVRETVIFSARLRLDTNLVDDDKKKLDFCDQILREVELASVADLLVGTDEDGLSFEQKKRLSIGVELAAAPSILFLDEPTSGLDARSALLVVRLLRKISNSGRTVVATIHQPSSTVFEMFDDLLLLKQGGQVVYHGELGQDSRTLIQYFESHGATPIELGDNPGNWILRVLQDASMGDHAALYTESDEFQRLQGELARQVQDADPTQKISYENRFATSRSVRQFLVNNRLRMIYWRSPTYNLGRIMISIVLSILLGAVFIRDRKITTYTESDIRARISVLFFSNIIVGIMSIVSVQPVMTWLRDMFYRHRASGMYGSWNIGFALGTAESIFIAGSSAIFCFLFLAASGLGFSVQKITWFWAFFAFNNALYSYFGQLFVCSVKAMKTAMILAGVYIGFNNLFSGLIIRPQTMIGTPYAITYYITPGHYVFEGEVTAIMSNDARSVEATVGSAFNRWMVQQDLCSLGQQPCVGTQGNYVEYFFGGYFSPDHIPYNAIILAVLLLLVRLFTWAALEYIKFSD